MNEPDFKIRIVDVKPVSKRLPFPINVQLYPGGPVVRGVMGFRTETVHYIKETYMPVGMEEIENWFTYHAPDEAQQVAYRIIRDQAKEFAKTIVNNTPPSADQTVALRKLREVVMIANSAIACGGK